MNAFSQIRFHNIRWKFQEKRKRIAEDMMLRRKMVESSYHMQLRNDRNAVQAQIAHLQPGPRRVYLQAGLTELNRPVR